MAIFRTVRISITVGHPRLVADGILRTIGVTETKSVFPGSWGDGILRTIGISVAEGHPRFGTDAVL
jgi:hypothetical protein